MMFEVLLLWVYIDIKMKNIPDHRGNWIYKLWNGTPMLCQLGYAIIRFCTWPRSPVGRALVVGSIRSSTPAKAIFWPAETAWVVKKL